MKTVTINLRPVNKWDTDKGAYEVVKVTNSLTPVVGNVITEIEAGVLVRKAGTTVNITERK